MSKPTLSASLQRRYRQADRIEDTGVFAMVACTRCTKNKLPCKLSSLHKKCGNCVRYNSAVCEPDVVPLPDYSKIDAEMERLEVLEEKEEALLRVEEDLAEGALLRARQAREKLSKLRKQKKLLRRKEQKLFDEGMSTVEELEALEAREELAQEAASVNPETPLGAATVDWSVLWNIEPESAGGS